MKPNPTRQRKQAHRQRLALGRALHQVLAIRYRWRLMLQRHLRNRLNPRPPRFTVPRILWKHAKVLRMALVRA